MAPLDHPGCCPGSVWVREKFLGRRLPVIYEQLFTRVTKSEAPWGRHQQSPLRAPLKIHIVLVLDLLVLILDLQKLPCTRTLSPNTHTLRTTTRQGASASALSGLEILKINFQRSAHCNDRPHLGPAPKHNPYSPHPSTPLRQTSPPTNLYPRFQRGRNFIRRLPHCTMPRNTLIAASPRSIEG
jgi:hypothetical protein